MRDKLIAATTAFGDVQTQITSAKTQLASAQTQLHSANDSATHVLADANTLRSQISEARDRLAAIPELQQRQTALENTVRNFVNRTPGAISSETEIKMNNIITRYEKYLTTIGLSLPEKPPDFKVVDNIDPWLSSYDLGGNLVAVYKGVIDDPSVWLRDFTHQVIFNQPLASSDQKMSDISAVYPVESILGFYLPCSFLNNPWVGELAAKLLGPRVLLYVIDFSKKD